VSLQAAQEGDFVLKLGTLSDQVPLLILKTPHFLPIVAFFVALHILCPKVVRALQHLVDPFFFVDEVEPELVRPVGAHRRQNTFRTVTPPTQMGRRSSVLKIVPGLFRRLDISVNTAQRRLREGSIRMSLASIVNFLVEQQS